MTTTRTASASRALAAGIVSAALSLALVELVAGTTPLVPSAIDAVSQQVIPYSPESLTRWAIDTFGTNDVAVLNAGTTVITLLVGAAAGVAARRRFGVAALLFVAFGALGLWASLARSESSFPLVVVTLTGAVVAGLLVLRWLIGLAAPGAAAHPRRDEAPARSPLPRRGFIAAAAGVGALAVVSAATGRFLLRDRLARVDPRQVALPSPADALPPAPAAATLDVPGLTPLFVPNERFYVIDTAVAVPQVDPANWSLRIHGMVDEEVELTYDDLLALPLEEIDVTIACVSNEVGGDLVGNARWLGTRLDALLERAGVQDGAEQVLGRSTDGFTAGFPVEAAIDGRGTMIAVGMNGAPLPTRHGFPARLIVPGLYGYVSATKWLSEIELTTWDVDGYWIPRGWAKEGPIKTQARIDVPSPGAAVDGGEVVVAGVAWAPTRGISGVEVRLDDGEWVPAELSEALSSDTWVQWVARIEAAAGDHVVEVRATDGAGETQPETPAPPAPDGAQGWDRTTFRVS